MKYRDIYNVTTKDLIALCDLCHASIHRGIKYGIIPKRQNRDIVKAMTDEVINKTIADRRKPVVFDEAICRAIDKASINIQRRVCGVLKCATPKTTFLEWVGGKTTHNRMCKIRRLLA